MVPLLLCWSVQLSAHFFLLCWSVQLLAHVCCSVGPTIGPCFSVTVLEIHLNLVARCHPVHITEVLNHMHVHGFKKRCICSVCISSVDDTLCLTVSLKV